MIPWEWFVFAIIMTFVGTTLWLWYWLIRPMGRLLGWEDAERKEPQP